MPTRSQIEFIKMWRAVSVDGALHKESTLTAWEAEHGVRIELARDTDRYICGASHLIGWVLTPRGADLVATARGIDLDTLAPDDGRSPERITGPNVYDIPLADCPDCEGGRIPVIVGSTPIAGPSTSDYTVRVWDMGCTTCGGKGKVTAGVAAIMAADAAVKRLDDACPVPRQPEANPGTITHAGFSPPDFIEVASKFSDRAGMAGALTGT